MDLTTRWNIPGLKVETVAAGEQHAKCAVCSQLVPDRMFAFHERVDLPVPSQTWRLCGDCAAAVVTQLERSSVHSPLRVRIAVGIVAADRRPQPRRTFLDWDYWDEMPNEQMDKLAAGFVLFMFLMPPLVFMLVMVFVVINPLGH